VITYFETTALILACCFALSLAVSWLAFGRATRRRGTESVTSKQREAERLGSALGGGAVLPALVLGSIALVGGFRWLGINLLYPVRVLSDGTDMLRAAAAPAIVLVLASGLAGTLVRSIAVECDRWRRQPFVVFARALGRGEAAALRRLVLVKSVSAAWGRCLPWLFGELIVVEVVFNAPGLGLDAWHAAQARDPVAMATALVWLAGLYGICALAAAAAHGWIGRRLESYA
jgi:ABC-type dipeptide/oligopeptide/nickel transport system permease component